MSVCVNEELSIIDWRNEKIISYIDLFGKMCSE